jgi:uncharacterized protein DUF3592
MFQLTLPAHEPRTVLAIIVTSGVGLTFIIWSVLEAIKGARTRRWPSAHGVITTSRLEPDYRSRSGTQFYRVVIYYHFSPASTSQVGHRVSIGDHGGGLSIEEAQCRARRYAEGVAVEVHYDPLDPTETVLETGISGKVVIVMIVGLLTLGAAGLLLVRGV